VKRTVRLSAREVCELAGFSDVGVMYVMTRRRCAAFGLADRESRVAALVSVAALLFGSGRFDFPAEAVDLLSSFDCQVDRELLLAAFSRESDLGFPEAPKASPDRLDS
jgi:hypothetical protein